MGSTIIGTVLTGDRDTSKIRLISDGAFGEYDGREDTWYSVHGTVFQPQTNTRFKVEKQFDDYTSAKDYVEKLVSDNPLASITISKRTEKECARYV